MSRSRFAFPRAAVLSLGLALGSAFIPGVSAAQSLPEPYVSRALDAVLIPIDTSVISAFGLARGSSGVLVLATQPGGLAEAAGILPGDVLSTVKGKKIRKPIDVDELVLFWILNGITDFGFDVWHGDYLETYTWQITEDYYYETIDISSVSTWSSYSYESFSYDSYYSEYSESFSESYEYSEMLIEETVNSEEFSTEMTSEYSEETTIEEASDTEATETDGEYAVTDDSGDEMGTDEAVDDGSDAAVEEDVSEEPAYEEPAYEEPAYEEPAYEEPAYDDES
jgi:hypothetical protein